MIPCRICKKPFDLDVKTDPTRDYCDNCAGAQDWQKKCENCGETPTVVATGLCGPCTWGEAATAGGDW